MSFLVTTFSLILGLYFFRNNIVLSILLSLGYLFFVFWRLGKRMGLVCLMVFGIGMIIPKIPLPVNHDSSYGGIVIDARDNYIIFQSKFTKYYVYSENNDYEIGDFLTIKGQVKDLKFNSYESQFNFEKYLNNKGTQREIFVDSIDVRWKSFIKIHHFKNQFLSKFDEDAATLISAFLFNDKDYSSDIVKTLDRNGLIYLFSLSGIYLNILFAVTNYIINLKCSRKKAKILTLFIYLPLAFFSFTRIGTLRVYGLYFLKYLNEFAFKRRKFTHIELVCLLALIFIAIDYHLVYQEAFYIGFLLSAFTPILLNATKCLEKKKRKYVNMIILNILVIPLMITSSYVYPLNIMMRPLLVSINFLFILISAFSTFLPITKLVNFLAKGELWILEKVDSVNIRIPVCDWNGVLSIIICGVTLLIVFYLESVRIKHAKIAALCLVSLITISITPFQEPITNAVYFVNVGQGDSIIIKNKNKTIMIDTGGNKSCDMAVDTLIPFMNKKKITHIDALILTHDDFDHSGAKDSLISNFKVNEVITSKKQFPYKIGNLNIENLNTYCDDGTNDSSLVLMMDFMNKKFLFTGDASSEIEKKIIKDYNVDCDILKIGHHGSKYSTCEAFLKATTPKEAIISVGAKNYYGHPSDNVIDLLNKYDVKIRRTDLEGTICYFSLLA